MTTKTIGTSTGLAGSIGSKAPTAKPASIASEIYLNNDVQVDDKRTSFLTEYKYVIHIKPSHIVVVSKKTKTTICIPMSNVSYWKE